jgi:hypothetical protein
MDTLEITKDNAFFLANVQLSHHHTQLVVRMKLINAAVPIKFASSLKLFAFAALTDVSVIQALLENMKEDHVF